MSVLYRLWLRLSLCWQRGQDAEAVRLCLLNDALHREGKLRGRPAPYAPLPRWRALALRGERTHDRPRRREEAYVPMSSEKDVNHILFLTVPDSMFRVRRQ